MKIISSNGYEPLFASYKLNILLDEIWEGKNTFDCDGQLENYSMITHLAKSPIHKVPNKRMRVGELLSNNFKI
jgi:hypothetical protein